MARTYTLKKRADQQAATRQRIVDAAIDLHGRVGPARTTFSMVAEQAGVQRHTLYAHFPDERSLLLACSGQHLEQSPPPDAANWRGIEDRTERLRSGLTEIYGWFGENAGILERVMRDAADHDVVREISQMRFGPALRAWHDVLGAKLNAKQRAMLHLALSFHTWQNLVQDGGLKQAAAVKAMVHAIETAGDA